MNKDQKYCLQIKERKIVKSCYESNELPFLADFWICQMIGYNLSEMQTMIENSLCKSDYRIVTYPQMEVVK